MEFEISLKDLSFYAYHGVLKEERITGNEFRVNVSIILPINDKIEEDELDGTVSYAELFNIVSEEMSFPRNLLETVAFRIAKKIKERFEVITSGWISIEKVRPPIPDMLGKAAVSLIF